MSGKDQLISAIMIIFVAVFISLAVVVSGAPDFFKDMFDEPKSQLDANTNELLKELNSRMGKLEELPLFPAPGTLVISSYERVTFALPIGEPDSSTTYPATTPLVRSSGSSDSSLSPGGASTEPV